MGNLHKARPCESSEAVVVLQGCPELMVVVMRLYTPVPNMCSVSSALESGMTMDMPR